MSTRTQTTHVIYDGGTIKEFETHNEACMFMDEMEDVYGYCFEYKGVCFGVETYKDANHIGKVMRF